MGFIAFWIIRYGNRMSWSVSEFTHRMSQALSPIPKTECRTQRIVEVNVNADGEKIVTVRYYTVDIYDYAAQLRTYTNMHKIDYTV